MKNKKYANDVGWVILMSLMVSIPYVLGISLFEITAEGMWLLVGLIGGVFGTIVQLFVKPNDQDKEEDTHSGGIFFLTLLSIIVLTFVMYEVLDSVSEVRTGFIDGLENVIYGWVLCHLYGFVFAIGVVIKSKKGKKIRINLVPIMICLIILIAGAGTIAIVDRINESAEWHERYEEERAAYDEEVVEQEKNENIHSNENETKSYVDRRREKIDPNGPFNEQECNQLREMAKQFTYDLELDTTGENEWPGITWKKEEGEYHVVELDFSYHEGVKGKMNLSDFGYLQRIELSGSSVTEVTIPKSAIEIELKQCEKLKKITFCKGVKKLNHIILPRPYGEYSLERIVFLGNAPQVDLDSESEFNCARVSIYHKKNSKGWDDEVWEDYNVKILE